MKDIVFLEGILAAVASQDTQKRLKAAEDLSNYLSDPSNGIEFIGFDKLLDGLVGWVNSSNFKVRKRWKQKLSWKFDFVLVHNRSREFTVSFASGDQTDQTIGWHGPSVNLVQWISLGDNL